MSTSVEAAVQRALVFQDDVYAIDTLHDGVVYVPRTDVAPQAPRGTTLEELVIKVGQTDQKEVFTDYVDPTEVEGITYLGQQWLAAATQVNEYMAFDDEAAAWKYLFVMHPEVFVVALARSGVASITCPSPACVQAVQPSFRLFDTTASVNENVVFVQFTPALYAKAGDELRRLGYTVSVR